MAGSRWYYREINRLLGYFGCGCLLRCGVPHPLSVECILNPLLGASTDPSYDTFVRLHGRCVLAVAYSYELKLVL